jgi:predicted nucleic acid-binding protein
MLWQSTTCCGIVSGEGGAVCGCPWQPEGAEASAAGFILEVYREIAVAIRGSALLGREMERTGLAAGEVSTVLLAKELEADLVLIDENKARRYAVSEGLLVVTGCIGILESLYRRNDLPDLRGAYIRLLAEKFRIDLQTLRHSLARFKLPPL